MDIDKSLILYTIKEKISCDYCKEFIEPNMPFYWGHSNLGCVKDSCSNRICLPCAKQNRGYICECGCGG